ncbi:MAG: hypothetical protein R6X18_19255 [Chloroflexota bacterium]
MTLPAIQSTWFARGIASYLMLLRLAARNPAPSQGREIIRRIPSFPRFSYTRAILWNQYIQTVCLPVMHALWVRPLMQQIDGKMPPFGAGMFVLNIEHAFNLLKQNGNQRAESGNRSRKYSGNLGLPSAK